MNKNFLKNVLILCLLAFLFCGIGCAKNSLNERYKNDAYYYLGLQALQNKDENSAERYFRTAIRKASSLIKRHSMEKYAELGSVQNRIDRKLALYKAFPCEETLKLICKEFYEQKEYSRIINLTQNLNLQTAGNELVFYRIDSLYKKNNSKFENEFFTWCTQRPFLAEHYKMYCILPECDEIIEFRTLVYNRNYDAAVQKARQILENPQNHLSQILSDAGKSFLYSSNDFLNSAFYLEQISQNLDDEGKFYTYFYAGRCFDKANSYRTRALKNFSLAMEYAPLPENYDNALWYYLNTSLKNSISSTIIALEKYGATWNNPYYFDDFFETLSVRLLSQHMFTEFYQTAKLIKNFASKEMVAKYSYISARLIQENFIKLEKDKIESETKDLFTQALSSDTDMYYRLLSCQKLELSQAEITKVIQNFGKRTQIKVNEEAEKLLLGYADFGLPQFIYEDWQRYSEQIGIDCVQKISLYLQKCGNEKNNYFTQSLRIASRKANYPEQMLYPQFFDLVYPQNFKNYVSENCALFNLNEYILYALIRSESFFNPQVASSAGAIGLTQLMEGTAADVARKLKIPNYDLRDSATNIKFGAYYLEEMKRRLDDSVILAVFAYNGGITRVRQWVKSANLEFGTQNLPKDLFLESLPFEETREYGRKILAASAMYAYLYYNLPISQVIEEILQ